MKQGILIAGAVALAFAGAAAAKPPHAGQGKGRGAAMAQQGRDIAAGRFGQHAFGEQYGYGRGGCPPGLRNKNPQCMPPGLYRQQFQVGQRLPLGYRGLLGYDALPDQMRSYYGGRIDPYSRYMYDDQYLYRVDPKTMIVSEVLRGLLYR